MKYIVYSDERNLQDRIVKAVSAVLPEAIGDVSKDVMDCYTRGVNYDYAFITPGDEGLPWTELMLHLADHDVRVYLITDNINREVLNLIKESNGYSAIHAMNIEEEIRGIFINFKESEVEKEEIPVIQIDRSMSFEEYKALKSRKYPATIVSFHSAKGGTGKTTLAVNTAIDLAQRGLKTIILDYDIENGNIDSMLHMKTSRDLKDLARGNSNYTEKTFEQHTSGVYVLPSLKIPAESEIITAEVAERIIGRLARIFDIIIIDTGEIAIDPMLVAMQVSTRSYFVTNCDMTTIAKTYRLIEEAKMINIDMDKCTLVMNRVPKKIPIKENYVRDYIDMEVANFKIPENEEVVWAVNNGEIAIDRRGNDNYARAVKMLADDIIESTELKKNIVGKL